MSDAVLCKCGATETRPDDATRCRRGHTLQGHAGPALRHGAWSFERGRGDAALPSVVRETADDFKAGVVADLGGPDELTTLKRGYVSRLYSVDVCCRLLEQDLVRNGLFTERRRVRGTYDKLLRTIEVWDRLATRLGLERKTRTVTFAQAVINANRTGDE